MQNERKVLVSALLKAEKNGYSNLILDHMLKETDLNNAGRGFVTSAFYGVLERKISIDFVLNQFLKRPIRKAPPFTAAVLRSAVYQILFMDKIPSSAAVNEAVKLIKKSKENGNSGLVNAVLRKIADGDCCGLFEAAKDPSIKYSVEPWMFDALSTDYSKEQAEAFFADSLNPPPVFIRINTLKPDALKTVLEEFTSRGGRLEPTDLEHCYKACGCKGIEQLHAYRNGLFFVQDYSSQLCAKALGAKAGERILDCCAAPGGKTFSIALGMEDRGEIVSSDLYEQRVGLIQKGAERLGLTTIRPITKDAAVFDPKLGLFDRVICDAPCSGIGVVRRKPEIKYKSDSECAALPPLQKEILKTAARYVKSGGRLIYSTCTLLKRENDAVVEDFLKANPEFSLAPVFAGQAATKTFLPPADLGDGFFVAVMERA